MIPYIDFRKNTYFNRTENPFESSDVVMRVFVDAETVDDENLEFIENLGDKINVEVITTSSNGAHRIILVEEKDGLIRFESEDLKAETTVHHAITDIDRHRHTSEILSGKYGKKEDIFAAIITSRMAESLDAHLVVTNNKILLDNKDKGILNVVQPVTPYQGIAVVGLLLRTRGVFRAIASQGQGYSLTNEYSRWMFYWAAAREYLNEGWRLVSSTTQLKSGKAKELSLALHSRVSNVLRCRDEIQKNLLIKQTNDSVENSIFYFEYYLLNVTALFDILARIVDEIYEPKDSKDKRIKTISWRSAWRLHLEKVAPELAEEMKSNNLSRDVLEFAAILRNYIHAEGLLGSQHSRNGSTAPILMQVPKDETIRLKPIIKRLWKDTFTEHYLHDEGIMLDIGTVIESLTPMAFDAITNLINNIQFTHINGFDETLIKGEPDSWVASTDKIQILRLIGLR